MASLFAKEIVGSLILTITGVIMFTVCCNIETYQYNYYYVDSTLYLVTQIFFWIGLIFFVTGLINLFRASIRQRVTRFKGVTLSTAPQPTQPTHTSVMIVGTVLPSGYHQDGLHSGSKQQFYPTQPSIQQTYNSQSIPSVPPPYSPNDYNQKNF